MPIFFVPVPVPMPVPVTDVRHTGTPAVAVLAQGLEEPRQLDAFADGQAPEDLFGRDPPGTLETLEQSVTARRQTHQDRSPIVGIGGPDDEARRFHPVDHGGHRARHDLESCGDIGHLERLSCSGDDP
ncbi:MAG TPA: hypothetical protein VN799_05655 [Acidimicrobiales bacterium]|nr:hypothetical protein [Acidimicrobiales bacterium]